MEYLQYYAKGLMNKYSVEKVLNLVISGIPSILNHISFKPLIITSFKPCYKWNTFNTMKPDNYGRVCNEF